MPAFDDSFRAILSRVYLNAGGELDARHSDVLRERLLRSFDQTSDKVLLVCTQVVFVDSSGLRVLLEMERVAESRHIRLVLVNPSRPLQDLLTLTGLTDAFDIDDRSRPSRHAEMHHANGSALHGFPVPDLPQRIPAGVGAGAAKER